MQNYYSRQLDILFTPFDTNLALFVVQLDDKEVERGTVKRNIKSIANLRDALKDKYYGIISDRSGAGNAPETKKL